MRTFAYGCLHCGCYFTRVRREEDRLRVAVCPVCTSVSPLHAGGTPMPSGHRSGRPGIQMTNVRIINFGTGIRMNGGALYGSDVHISGCEVGVEADGAIVDVERLIID